MPTDQTYIPEFAGPCCLVHVPDGAPLQRVTLAKSLGIEAMVYLSTSHGVELEVQAGSLVDEVHHPVTVSPHLQFVECRTEGSGRWGAYALAPSWLWPC